MHSGDQQPSVVQAGQSLAAELRRRASDHHKPYGEEVGIVEENAWDSFSVHVCLDDTRSCVQLISCQGAWFQCRFVSSVLLPLKHVAIRCN